jgi:SAM-dependent methyltransferase
VAQSKSFPNGAQIFRGDLEKLLTENPYKIPGFDLIMFHHSFEHSPQPLRELEFAKKLLKPNGKILVRIPVSASYAADTYGEYWFQLDAPRHIYLFNEKSMEILAGKVALKVEKIYYDSIESQFWASEQYKKGIPLFAENSFAKSRKNSMFSRAQIRRYQKESKRLNSIGLGDQAGFILSSK